MVTQRQQDAALPRAHRARPRQWRRLFAAVSILVLMTGGLRVGFGQRTQSDRTGSHSSRGVRPGLTPAARAMVEQAIGVVCTEAKTDPKGSVPIDDMQARPSLSVQSPEAVAGALRAQKLLPVAKNLVVNSLRQLVNEYGFQRSRFFDAKIQKALERVQAVRKVRPDMDSRDNASVFLSRPHTITFGTIFLAGLPSDEGMISVLAHELTHIADGEGDSLRVLVQAVASRASGLTGLAIRGQRAEELTCDLVGAMTVRSYVADSPSYEPLTRRLARSIEHNCVDQDEGDEEHLSPRNTIRALLALNPTLARELVYGQEERLPTPTLRSN
jgi:Zn-dependent protease with chaperone function